jgi:hypothetical protein
MPQKLRPRTSYNSRNRKSHASTSRIRRTRKPPRSRASARVGSHGEAALEGCSTVSSAQPRPENEGVAAVESDDWLDED